MDKIRLQELAGIPLNEQMPKTTPENPLVVVWSDAVSKDYPEQGLIGHMHLSTAAKIHGFETDDLAKRLRDAGEGKRIKAGNVHLEYSKWNEKELNEAARGTIDWSVRNDVQRVLNIAKLTKSETSTLSDSEIREANHLLATMKSAAQKFETLCYDASERAKRKK